MSRQWWRPSFCVPHTLFSTLRSLSSPRESSRSIGKWMVLPAICMGLLVTGVQAQTAHFDFAQTTVVGSLSAASAVAVDSNGNVYVADSATGQVLKESFSGGVYTQTTVASGLSSPVGVAVDANGNVYIAESGNKDVIEEKPSGSSYTASTVVSGLGNPVGVAVDASGNVYIADSGNKDVIEEKPSGASYTQTTVASGLNSPVGVAVDGSGNVYIADSGNQNVLKETLAGSSYSPTTVASGLGSPVGVAVDGNGNVYIADSGNQNVLKETLSGVTYTQSVVANATANGLNSPVGVAVDGNGSVYVADTGAGQVLKLALSGVDFGTVPVGTASTAIPVTFTFDTGGQIQNPSVLTMGVANLDFKSSGTGTCFTNGTSHTYAANDTCTVNVVFKPTAPGSRKGAVVLKSSAGTTIATAYVYGTGKGPLVSFSPSTDVSLGTSSSFNYPVGVAVDGSGNIYVANSRFPESVEKLTPGCTAAGCITSLNIGTTIAQPFDLAMDGAGNLYVTDLGTNSVDEIPAGCTTTSCIVPIGAGSGKFNTPTGVAVDGSGNVYVANYGNDTLQEVPAGCTSASCTVNLGGGFGGVYGVAVDGAGNVYVADASNGAVVEMPPNCKSVSCTIPLGGGNGAFSKPTGVAVDPAGNVFVADLNSGVLSEMTPGCTSSSCVSAVPGTFGAPIKLALDAKGNLYVTGYNGFLLTEVDRADAPSLSFATTNVGQTSTDSPKSVTVMNIGNGTLTFPIPTGAGAYNPSVSSNFAYNSSSTCLQNASSGSTAFTLASNASCSVAVDFTPVTAGSVSGSVTLTDDNGNAASPAYATQTIGLSGTGTAVLPGAPTIGTAVAGDAQATVAFTPPTFTGGVSINSYTATSSPGGLTGTCASSPCTVTGLTNGTAYTFTVTATNSVGTGPASAASNSVTPLGSQTITFASPGSQVYGTSPTLSATATSGLAVTFTSTTPTVCTVTSAGVLTTVSVGSCTIDANQSGNGVYAAATQVTQAFAITQAPLSVTVNNQSRAYGAANPTLTGTVTGLVNGDTAASVGLTYSTTATASSAVGSYPITASITSGNYKLTTTPGTLQVTAADLSVTVNNQSRTYGAANPTLTGTVTGLVNGDTATSVGLTYSTTATVSSPVGAYPITASITSTNYKLTMTPGTLQVTAANLSVTVNNQTRAYGAANPTFTATVTGLVGGDTATSIGLTYSTTATVSSPVGAYPITASITSANYKLTTTPGTLQVTAANLSVMVDNASRVFGTANPTFTGVVSGLVNGDTAASIGLTYSTTATVSSPVGAYPITASITSTNYKLSMTPGTLQVTSGNLVVSANNVTKVYGAANPSFTGTVTGAQNGDTFTESFSTTATTSSSIGQYPIVPSVTGADLSSYTVTIQDGTLTVVQAGSAVSITSSASNANLKSDVTFTATVTSLTSGTPTGSVEFLDGSTVLGSSTLNSNGTAIYTTNTLTAGLHQITAVYSGDQNFTGATSAALAEIVTAPDFSMLLSPTSLTVKPGQTADVNIQFVPMGGFTGTATFQCMGLPVGATCKFSPAQLTADGSNTVETTKLTITTTGPNKGTVAMNQIGLNNGGTMLAGIFWLPGMFFGGFLFWQRKKLTATHRQLLMMIVLVSFVGAMAGCGFPPPNTAPGTSTVSITATTTGSNGVASSHTVTFILTVQQ